MVFPTEDQHAISTTLKYAYVKHNLPEPFPQVYIWKKKQIALLRVPCTRGQVWIITTKYTKMGA